MIIGIFELGYECVEVDVLKNDTGGSFTLCHSISRRPRIAVGLAYEQYHQAVGCLIHEALEFSLTRLQARFMPSLDLAADHSAYLFSFNHVTLSETSFMVAEFMTAAMPLFREAWENRAEPEV